MTARHRTNNYMRAFAALILGYHHLHLLDDVRMGRRRRMNSSGELGRAAEKEKVLAAKG
jgi:hypothetical protein